MIKLLNTYFPLMISILLLSQIWYIYNNNKWENYGLFLCIDMILYLTQINITISRLNESKLNTKYVRLKDKLTEMREEIKNNNVLIYTLKNVIATLKSTNQIMIETIDKQKKDIINQIIHIKELTDTQIFINKSLIENQIKKQDIVNRNILNRLECLKVN